MKHTSRRPLLEGFADVVNAEAMPPLEHHVRAALARWPQFAAAEQAYRTRHQALAREGRPPPLQYAGDLFITQACVLRLPGAFEALEATFFDDLKRSIRRIDSSAAFVGEALQAVREKLYVGAAGAPKLGEYAGRAALKTWLSAVGVRTALNLIRGRGAARQVELAPSLAGQAPVSLEGRVLRVRYKSDFEAALALALSSLNQRDRTLLKLHYVDGLGIDRLATIYGVGRSTSARWLAAAREAVGVEARAVFCQRTGLHQADFDSLAAAMRSELDLSLTSALKTAGGDAVADPPRRASGR